jgi:nifR3 family TIM-barrel protein
MTSLLLPFAYGGQTISCRLVLAPIAGVTDILFRALCKEQSAGLVFTEMVSDMGLVYSNKKTHDILEISPDERPIGAQIFGSNIDAMERGAEIVARAGPDFIDINMGCPVPKVVRNGEGCALMRDPALAAEIIRAVARGSALPVTVKIRKGWDAQHANAVDFARACEDAGASGIAVHGRTRGQFYSGRADWDIIRQVKQAVSIPVIGNGDVWEPQDAIRMIAETGCDAVMIARGSLGNPWIFRDALALSAGKAISPVGLRERVEMAIRHLRLTVEKRGERAGVPYMRKHIGWYLKGVTSGARVKDEINLVRSARGVEDALVRFLEENH